MLALKVDGMALLGTEVYQVAMEPELDERENGLDDDGYFKNDMAIGIPCDLDSNGGTEDELDQYLQVAEFNANEVVFVREHVCVWPSRTHHIPGRLSLVKQHCVLFMAWLPYGSGTLQEDGSFTANTQTGVSQMSSGDHAAYAIHPLPLSEVRLIRTCTPSRLRGGMYRLEITLLSGVTLPPLHFPTGTPSVYTFIDVVKQHVDLLPCPKMSGAWLINEIAEPLVRSLSALELGDVLLGGPPRGGAAFTWTPPAPQPQPLMQTSTSLTGQGVWPSGDWASWAANADTIWDVYNEQGSHRGTAGALVVMGTPAVTALAKSAWTSFTKGLNLVVQQAQWFAGDWDQGDELLGLTTTTTTSPGNSVGSASALVVTNPATDNAEHSSYNALDASQMTELQNKTHTSGAAATKGSTMAGAGAVGATLPGHGLEPSAASDEDDYEMVDRSTRPVCNGYLHAVPLPPLSDEECLAMQDQEGRFSGVGLLRERVWSSGVSPGARRDVWPVLLGLRLPSQTAEEALEAVEKRRSEYAALAEQWRQVLQEQLPPPTNTWWDSCSRISKDVPRTDRSQPLFAADGCAGGRALRRLLLAYITLPGSRPYCQGMSDLASPLLVVLRSESEAFWAFVRIMESMGGNFDSNQASMHTQLAALQQLLQLVDPPLHAHLEAIGCTNYFFAFRWLLIFYKREFKYDVMLRLWESLWCAPSPHMHLYLGVAILVHHRRAILTQVQDFDGMLKFCCQLAGALELETLLRLAAMLHSYVGNAANDIITDCVCCQPNPLLKA